MCKSNIALLLVMYIVLVVFSSAVKATGAIDGINLCDVKVPYDYIVYDRLFCEIK